MITLRECTFDDLPMLQEISVITYKTTFDGTTSEADMKAYIEKAYNFDKLGRELLNPSSSFYFVYSDDQLGGYLKVNDTEAMTDVYDPTSLEVERIYILRDFQGKGLGRHMMEKAYEIAQEKKKAYIWLGVWEHNQNALRFYEKNGFVQIGQHPFIMGDEVQTDLLLRKDLTPQTEEAQP